MTCEVDTRPARARRPAVPPARGPCRAPAAEPLCPAYDAALLDLDGVVYLGGKAVPGAAEALGQAAGRGMRLAYVTNNASRSPSAIAAQISRHGRPGRRDRRGDLGAGRGAAAGRAAAGRRRRSWSSAPTRCASRCASGACGRSRWPPSSPLAVVQGYTPDLNYGLLTEAALALRAGACFVATNVDPTLPTQRGLAAGQRLAGPGAGRPRPAQRPEVAGQARAAAARRVGAAHRRAARPLVVGDRLDTDIEGGVRGGADSLLVLTGVSRPADAVAGPAVRSGPPTWPATWAAC